MSHVLSQRLREARQAQNLTQADLARALSANQSTVAYWENGRSQPDAKRIQAVAQILQVSPQWLMFGTPGVAQTAMPYANDAPWPHSQAGRDLPVRGLAQAGQQQALLLAEGAVSFVERPPSLCGNGQAFAVWVAGQSMLPRYRPGEMVYVDPTKPLSSGCFALVEMADHTAFIKEYMGQSRARILLRQYNPQRKIELPSAEIKGLYRIIGSFEG
jgi:phage repressor protein C with HTH and peptisase S24 domain